MEKPHPGRLTLVSSVVLWLLGLPLFPPPPCCPQCSKQPLGNRSHRSGRAGEWGGSSIGQSSQPSRWSFLPCQHTCLTARVQQGQAPLRLSGRKGNRGQGVGLVYFCISQRPPGNTGWNPFLVSCPPQPDSAEFLPSSFELTLPTCPLLPLPGPGAASSPSWVL